MNTRTEALLKALSGEQDDKSAKLGMLGEYLRSEILFSKLNTPNANSTSADKLPRALWLDTEISSLVANQMTKSSPIFDIFTRGPMTSYSGGAVVSYQLRDMEGRIKSAGTVWSYAPYRKSSNIMKFECQGVHDKGKKFVYEIPSAIP